MDCLTVLEAGSPPGGVSKAGSEGGEGESAQTPVLAFGGLLALFGRPWLVDTSAKICLHLQVGFSLCVRDRVQISPFL